MDIKVEKWPAFVISGMKSSFPVNESFSRIPRLWQEASSNGFMDQLYALWSKSDLRPAGILGISSKSLTEPEMMDYFIAVATFVDSPGAQVTEFPEDMQSFKFPSVEWAIARADGKLPTAVSGAYRSFSAEYLPKSGYMTAPLPAVECYIKENRQEIWFPVVKKKA